MGEETLDNEDSDEAEDEGNHVERIEGAAESHLSEKSMRDTIAGEEFDDLDADAEAQDGGGEMNAPAIRDPKTGDHVDELDDEKIADVTANKLPARAFVGEDKDRSDEGCSDVEKARGTNHGVVFTMSKLGKERGRSILSISIRADTHSLPVVCPYEIPTTDNRLTGWLG
jgi:hypothetical protein